jgi:hypothetical protein
MLRSLDIFKGRKKMDVYRQKFVDIERTNDWMKCNEI